MDTKNFELVDLSQEIFQGMPVYGSHCRTYIFHNVTFDETEGKYEFPFQSRNLLMNEHGPTHTDAAAECNPAGKTIDQEPLDRYFTSAICLDVSHVPPKGFITRRILEEALKKSGLEVREGDTVLLYTGHHARTKDDPEKYLYENAGLDVEAADWLADKGIVNVGIDAASIDMADDLKMSGHLVCKNKPTMTNTEHLANLDKVAGKRFTYVGMPLKIRGGTGSPIRAVALLQKDE